MADLRIPAPDESEPSHVIPSATRNLPRSIVQRDLGDACLARPCPGIPCVLDSLAHVPVVCLFGRREGNVIIPLSRSLWMGVPPAEAPTFVWNDAVMHSTPTRE